MSSRSRAGSRRQPRRSAQRRVAREKAQASVAFDDAKVSPEKLVSTIDLLGFKAKLLQVVPAG